jgi:hypothetical protein
VPGTNSASMFKRSAQLKISVETGKFAIYAREEFFNDPQAYMSTRVYGRSNGYLQTGYKLTGTTAGVEYKPTENSYVRLEGRRMQMDGAQKIFTWDGKSTNTRTGNFTEPRSFILKNNRTQMTRMIMIYTDRFLFHFFS